jgi:hypothetical protein
MGQQVECTPAEDGTLPHVCLCCAPTYVFLALSFFKEKRIFLPL